MSTTTQTLTLIDKTSAFWYACGYNDFRTTGEPYIDPMEFANYWVQISAKPSHPSLQTAFQAFDAPVIDEVTLPKYVDVERCNCGCKYWDQDGLCHSCREPFTGVMS